MKRLLILFAGICILLCLVWACSIAETNETAVDDPAGSEDPSDPADPGDVTGPDPEEEGEPEEEIPDPVLFIGVKMVSETCINFKFSGSVQLISLSFEPELPIGGIEEGSTVEVYLEEAVEPGLLIKAELSVEDEWGYIIDVQAPFRAINKRVPLLCINELRTEYSKPKCEFIEFKILSPGNMGALRVFAAGNYKAPMIYEFSPLEVNSGDYVVLHLRTLDSLCVNEYQGLINESGGADSCPAAWDFWIPGSNKLLHKTDAVYVLDQDNKVLSAVLLSETPDLSWKKDYLAEAAAFLFRENAWKSPAGSLCSPADAVSSANINTAMTRSISRDEEAENTNTAADWYVTANGGVTPGWKNSTSRF